MSKEELMQVVGTEMEWELVSRCRNSRMRSKQ